MDQSLVFPPMTLGAHAEPNGLNMVLQKTRLKLTGSCVGLRGGSGLGRDEPKAQRESPIPRGIRAAAYTPSAEK